MLVSKKGRLLAGGVAFGRLLKIKETERTLEFNVSKEEFDEKFYHYFDLGRDYKKSTKFSPPIRGLKRRRNMPPAYIFSIRSL